MQRKVLYVLIIALLTITGFVSCEREISFDYPTAEAMVVFDGLISNEQVVVRISHTRPMDDSTKNHFVSNADVWIETDDGYEEQLIFDKQQNSYLSETGLTGTAGHTYKMRAVIDGAHYEATTTMPPPAQVDTIFFRWIDVLNQTRVFFVCVKGEDPLPDDQRNYYLLKLMRGTELFRWNPHSGRSSVNGKFEYDIVCSSESDMNKGIDDDGKRPLMDGDTLHLEMMTIDRQCWLYYQSLSASDNTMVNPLTNIQGGALGIFMAANITRPLPLVFDKKTLLMTSQ